MNENHTVIYNEKKKRTPLRPATQLFRAVVAGSLLLAVLFFFQAERSSDTTLDVSGVWEGTVVQDPGGIFPVYPFRVLLYQHDGQITGASHIWLPDNSAKFGIIELEGTVDNGMVHLTETTILEQDLYSQWRWCLKTVALTLEDGTLSGRWSAPGCVPGSLELTRVASGE